MKTTKNRFCSKESRVGRASEVTMMRGVGGDTADRCEEPKDNTEENRGREGHSRKFQPELQGAKGQGTYLKVVYFNLSNTEG